MVCIRVFCLASASLVSFVNKFHVFRVPISSTWCSILSYPFFSLWLVFLRLLSTGSKYLCVFVNTILDMASCIDL